MPCCDCRACKAVGACTEKTKCCQHPDYYQVDGIWHNRKDTDRIRHLEAASIILGEIVALVPLPEVIETSRNGRTLIDWLKRHLTQASGEVAK